MNFLLSLSLRSYTKTEEKKLRELDWSAEIPSPNFQWNRRSLDFHSLVIPKNAAKKNSEWVKKTRVETSSPKVHCSMSFGGQFEPLPRILRRICCPMIGTVGGGDDGDTRDGGGSETWQENLKLRPMRCTVCASEMTLSIFYIIWKAEWHRKKKQHNKKAKEIMFYVWESGIEMGRDGMSTTIISDSHVILLVFFFRENFSCTWTSLKLRVIMASRHK